MDAGHAHSASRLKHAAGVCRTSISALPSNSTRHVASSPQSPANLRPAAASPSLSATAARSISSTSHARRKGSPADLEGMRKRLSGGALKSHHVAALPEPSLLVPAAPSLPLASAELVVADAVQDMDFEKWLAGFVPSQGLYAQQCHSLASRQPLINVSTLAELELDNIVNNGRLRHDINFDRELHFRPNTDGSKGKDKLLQSQQYWTAVQVELEFCNYMLTDPSAARFRGTAKWSAEFKKFPFRLAYMFEAIKSILMTLVPDEDQERLSGVLDVPFLLHGIEHGNFDLSCMADLLNKLLKEHCAPMRDQWIDNMAAVLRRGNDSGNPAAIVEGLQQLFAILEAMKLDVANHQIRYLRPRLLEDSIAFEHNYFQRKIAQGHVNLDKVFQWYCEHDLPVLPPAEDRLDLFVSKFLDALLRASCAAPLDEPLPDTFKLDTERLEGLQRSVHHQICTSVTLSAVISLLNHIKTSAARADSILSRARELVQTIIGSTPSQEKWNARIPNIAAELIRVVLAEDASKADGSECATLSEELERWLREHTNPTSEAFREEAAHLHETLSRLVPSEVHHMVRWGPNALCEGLLKARKSKKKDLDADEPQLRKYFARNGPASALETTSEAVQEVTKRITHLLILHWRVWAPIVEAYARDSAPGSPAPENRPTPEAGGALDQTNENVGLAHRAEELHHESAGAVDVGDNVELS